MGCDGGTIPKRDELVKTKKKKEQKDRTSERMYKWRHCSVSQAPLRSPVVACELGRLYSKEEIITRLLKKTQVESNIAHIRGLKDVKVLNLSPNPAYDANQEEQKGGENIENTRSPWICPVAALEMNGKHGFSFPWNCGCVVSNRALKEVRDGLCCKCGAPFSASDLITLNPKEDELKSLEANMEERRVKAKLAKKEAKRKAESSTDTEVKEKKPKTSKVNAGAGPSIAGPSSSKAGTSVSGLASSILRDTEFSSVRSKDFSVANNPNHSEVYKSIFDTHKSANKKLKSHWVTCNPLYY